MAIKRQAEVWVSQFGEILRELAENQLRSINEQIESLQFKLSRETNDLNVRTDGLHKALHSMLTHTCMFMYAQDLKFVLNAKKEIADVTMNMNIQFLEVAEKYRTLKYALFAFFVCLFSLCLCCP